MSNTQYPEIGTVECDHCGQTHEAEIAHKDRFSGKQLFAVVCTEDYLTDWYTFERVAFA